MGFKFKGNQDVFILKNDHPVKILGRTEFFNGKQPRYYVKSDSVIPGKSANEEWINEDHLTDIKPVLEPDQIKTESSLRKRPGIRKTGF